MEFNIDKSTPPTIYRSDNPQHYGKLAIDFAPETTPTIASFENLQQVKEWLIDKFGEQQYREWFPSGLAEELPGGQALSGIVLYFVLSFETQEPKHHRVFSA